MKNKIYKESAVYFLGSIIVAVLSFIVSLLYSHFINPSDYGVHSLAASTYMLISQFCGLWLSTGILRFSEKYKKKKNSDSFLGSIYITHLLISLFFIILLNIGAFLISNNLLFKQIFFIYSLIYFFEYNILLYNTNLRCDNKAKEYNMNIMMNNLFKILFLLILFYVFKYKSVKVIAISILITEVFQFLYFFIKNQMFRLYNYKLFNIKIMKEVFLYAFPLIGTTITGWVLNVSDRYVIKIIINSYSVGLYSYAYLLGNNLFWLLSNSIMLGAFPNMVKAYEENETEELSKLFTKYINIYMMIIIPCCFGIIAVAKTMFFALTSEMYHEAYNVFIITGIAISILGLCQFVNKIFELYKKTKTILTLNIISAIVNIILNFVFIYKFGYIGGAISTLLSHLLYLILALLSSKKYFIISWDFKTIFKYFISSVAMYFSILIFKSFIEFNSNVLCLISHVIIGIVSYFLFLFISGGLSKNSINEIKKVLLNNK